MILFLKDYIKKFNVNSLRKLKPGCLVVMFGIKKKSAIFFVFEKQNVKKIKSYMARITDPLLEPYFVGKDSHCYTVYESVAPKKTRAGDALKKGEKGTIYEKPQGHYSSFGAALQKIAKFKLNNEKEHYNSIKEYVERWDELLTELKKLQNYKNL